MNSTAELVERERLKVLRSLNIVGSERLPEFDAVVDTIATILNAPIALITIVEEEEVWFKALHGPEADRIPRAVSLCQYALNSNDVFVVENTLEDDRFRNNPHVIGHPHIQSYAGYPYSLDGVHHLGTVCILDFKPRSFSQVELQQLKNMAKVVEGLFKSHKALIDKEKALELAEREHQNAARKGDLLEEVAGVSGVGGWELCLDTDTLTWTDRTRALHEVPLDYQPDPETALDFFPAECQEDITAAINAAIHESRGWDLELPFVTAKGRRLWLRSAGRPIIRNDRVIRLIGALQDITEQRKGADLLQASEAIQRATLQSLSEGVLLLTPCGTIQSVNSAGAKLLGHSPEELIGTKVEDLDSELHLEGKDHWMSGAVLQTTAAHPERIKDMVAHGTRRGTSTNFWLRINASPVDTNSGHGLEGVVVSLKDVSQARLQEESRKAVFDNFPGGIAYRDKDTRLIDCNDVFREMFGYPDDLIERKADRREFMLYLAKRGDFGPGDPETLVDAEFSSWDMKRPTQGERQIADGRVLDARSTPLPDGGAVFTYFDITDRKYNEQAILRSEAIQRTTLEALSEGILHLAPDGEIRSANPAAADLFGYDVEDLIGLTVDQLDADMPYEIDGVPRSGNPLALAASAPHLMQGVTAQLSNSGRQTTTWLKINARSICADPALDMDGTVVSLTDITESKQQADTLKNIFDHMPGGLVYYDENKRLAVNNDSFQQLVELPKEFIDNKSHIEVVARYLAERGDYGPGDPEELLQNKLKDFNASEPHVYERESPNGVILEVRGIPLQHGGFLSSFFDVTERKRMEQELARSEQLARSRMAELEAILANMRQGVSVFDGETKLTMWNQQYIDIFGKPDGEVVMGRSFKDLIQAEKDRGDFTGDVDEHIYDLLSRLDDGEIVRSKFAHNNGKIVSVIHVPLPGGGWIGTHEDITLREQAAAKITHAAHHDSLTGLANRELFNSTLNEILAGMHSQGQCGCLLLLDLDKFKPVNDTYGHAMGDELLKHVALRLNDCVRSADVVARLGGDEFAIILQRTEVDVHRIAEIASRIIQNLRKPFRVYSETIEIGVSIGIAPIERSDNDISTLLRKADIALYEVKHQGRNDFRFYDENSKVSPIKPLQKAGGSGA